MEPKWKLTFLDDVQYVREVAKIMYDQNMKTSLEFREYLFSIFFEFVTKISLKADDEACDRRSARPTVFYCYTYTSRFNSDNRPYRCEYSINLLIIFETVFIAIQISLLCCRIVIEHISELVSDIKLTNC